MLPKRPGPYILGFLCVSLIALVVYLTVAVNSLELQHAMEKARQRSKSSRNEKSGLPIASTPARKLPMIDPDIQKLADTLAAKSETPERDLQIVSEFISLYSKAFQSNPVGGNDDIVAALTGLNASKGMLFPSNSPLIVAGQLVDRWGTPYWFHPESGTKMEIRSAGPDKDLFTSDDVILMP
jgi:hypothetical protein